MRRARGEGGGRHGLRVLPALHLAPTTNSIPIVTTQQPKQPDNPTNRPLFQSNATPHPNLNHQRQDMDKVKKAVGLRAYSSAQPLEEFRSEGNRLFLNLLGAYR